MNITMTDKAVAYFKKLQHGKPIYFGVKKTGCNGFAYVLEFADEHESSWQKISQEGIELYVDPKNEPLINGTVIDYEEEGFDSRVVFKNPNTKSECGCGESFSVDKG